MLPNLIERFPERYRRVGSDVIFDARDGGIPLMEGLIAKHRYYDAGGIWAPLIDTDKRVTAAIVESLGARSCLELGCYSGPVLSLLNERGIKICGVDVSHQAFLLAEESVHAHLRYGDLLSLNFDTPVDVFFGMDILEHLSPVKLGAYIAKIETLIAPGGFAYINSPMFGHDDVFGAVFQQYVPAWQEAGDDRFWMEWHCDEKGWPMHGHLIWASPAWWEAQFRLSGLVRDREVEAIFHRQLAGFFATTPARRSLFVLRRPGATPAYQQIQESR